MAKILFVFLFGFVLYTCRQATKINPQDSATTSKITQEDVTPDIKNLRREYVQNYKKELKIDTVIKGKSDEKLEILGKYYCLFDNAIVVPGKYNFDDTTKSFRTHNFAENFVIISNGDTVIKKTITKKDFLVNLPQNLRDYAVIFEPNFEGYNSKKDDFEFDFSVSIPLSDVGQLMMLSLRRNGQVIIKAE
jgi:hypothetical protein